MGVFKQAVITNEGERLLTKIMANTTALKFTHATTSNHEYPEDFNIKELKELEGIRQTTDVPSAQIEGENVVGVKALFENAKVEESYAIWNIGLYAESEEGEMLFAVCQAQTPDQMPAFKGAAPSAFIYDIRLAISQASSLTIVVNPSGTVNMQDLIELEKKKVSIQGGDTADTVVSSLIDSTESFPQPTAGDSQKTLWGKVKKWQQDCITKFGNYVLTSMITNQHLNSTSNIPTSALVYLMQQALTQLNSDKADKTQISKWDFIYDLPTSGIVQEDYSWACKNDYLKLSVIYHDWYIKAGTSLTSTGTLVATLPIGYRPIMPSIYEYTLSGYIVVINIYPDGRIELSTPHPIIIDFAIAVRMQSIHVTP